MRTEAERPTFLVGVLDFILANENDVADQSAVPARQVGVLRHARAVGIGMPGED